MTKDVISREEFDNLKELVLDMKDLLSKCNLKIDADFEELELEDVEESYEEEKEVEIGRRDI